MKESDLLKRIGIWILLMITIEFFVMYFFVRLSENDAKVVNQAGIVRGVSQRYVKLYLAGDFITADALAQKIDQVISSLQNGDENKYEKLNDFEFQKKLGEVSSSWSALKTAASDLRNEKQSVNYLVNISENHFLLTDQAVDAAEQASKNKIIISEIILFIIFGLELLALFLLRAITKKRIIRPLNIISSILPKAAAGDLSQRLPMTGNDEFGFLAGVFNKLVQRQQELTNNLENRIKEKTNDLENKILELKKATNIALLEKDRAEKFAIENEKFRLAVENAADHVIITDSEGTLIYGNPAAEQITGYSVEEMLGKKAGSLWGGLMDKEFYKKMWQTIKVDKKPFIGKLKNKRKNGDIYDAEISISPILDKNNVPVFFVGMERDITEQVAIDKAKTDFVSVVSHQLRTPLTAINWYGEILRSKESGVLNKKQKDYLREISSSNRRMVDLVNNLLNMSRLELGTLPVNVEEVDVCKVINDVINETTPIAKKNKIKVVLLCSTKSIKIPLDKNLLKFIFQNLITNAIKYSKSSKQVKVEISVESGKLSVIVKDSGIGIPIADQKYIFGKFFRAANASLSEAGGSGLGLYIAKLVSDYIGAKVWFESEENVGTTFYFNMPVTGMKKNK